MTGPGCTLTTFPSTPNVARDWVKNFARSNNSSRDIPSEIETGVVKRSVDGNLYSCLGT